MISYMAKNESILARLRGFQIRSMWTKFSRQTKKDVENFNICIMSHTFYSFYLLLLCLFFCLSNSFISLSYSSSRLLSCSWISFSRSVVIRAIGESSELSSVSKGLICGGCEWYALSYKYNFIKKKSIILLTLKCMKN